MATNGLIEEVLPQENSLILMPTMNLELAMQRLMEFQEFVKSYLIEGEDYGKIPGTPKPTLYKPGADKLCELYGLADSYIILAKTEDWDKGLFDYTIECQLTTRRSNQFISSGLGCCSTWESKYRYRNAKAKCPNCGKETIIKGKEEYGGGWVCFKKINGCGAKFKYNDPAITEQNAGKVDNPEIVDQKNTVLKMAKKRAKIDATLSATRSSGIFTQDLEDVPASGPRNAEEENDYATAGYDRDDFVKDKIDKLKNKPKNQPKQEEPEDQNYAWRMRIAKCSTVADFNKLFPDADNASDEIQVWIGKKAAACGYLYDRSKHCFYDPAEAKRQKLTNDLQASLKDTETPDPDPPSSPPEKRPSKRPPEVGSGLKLISKAQEIRIHEAKKESGATDAYYYNVLGRYGAEHAKELQKANFQPVLLALLDLKRM